jgi:hypothetical protein
MHTLHTTNVNIRPAGELDRAALVSLAQLDSTRYDGQPALVAEVDGQIEAAVSLDGELRIADPFRPTGELVALLTLATHR